MALAVIGVCFAIVLLSSKTAEPPEAPRRATPDERARIARRLATQEAQWRLISQRRFPGDRWSQDDDFHNAEQRAARAAAAGHRIHLSDVLLGIDEGLRADPRGRRTTASPCKPRPFYD
jgi:hypothetical protein